MENGALPPQAELAQILRPAGGGIYVVSTGKEAQLALQKRLYGVDSAAAVDDAFVRTLGRIAQAKVVVLGIPSDTGAGFRRGANLGPQALREAWLAARPTLAADFAAHDVVDIGDVFVVPQLLDDDMLSADQLSRSREAVYTDVPAVLRRALPVSPLNIAERAFALCLQINPNVKLLTLGGDHSTAWPAVKAMHDAGRRFCILQFDAHTDLLEERLGVRMCFATWSFHANALIGGHQRLVQAGIRASRFQREHWEARYQVVQHWAPALNAMEKDAAVDVVVAAVKATGLPCFLSNDIDGTDAAFASATGTPEDKGLHPDVVDAIIRRVGAEVGVVAGDMMEVAPLLETAAAGTTLATAIRYLDTTLEALLRPAPQSAPSI